MTVTNNGPSTARGVSVSAAIPALSLPPAVIQVVPVGPLVLLGSGLQAILGSMSKGHSQTLQAVFVPIVPAGALLIRVPPIIVSVSGVVSGTTQDPNPANNSFSVTGAMPFPAQVTQFTGGGAMPVDSVVITFSKKLQSSSVNAGTFLIWNADSGATISGSVSYDDPSASASFSMAGNGFPAGDYNVTLLGTGPSPILDLDGLALDGDADGKPGGDYHHQFGVG
jgi:hypothetical protein